jgi:hypothetical protein
MDLGKESPRHGSDASGDGSSRRRRWAPAVALLLLAPIVSEVLYGATRISVLFVLVPQIATWGCGALLIREAVRRRRRGWVSLLLLGVALAVAEECLIQQTSLAPMVGVAGDAYGRVLGVNWVYFLWALGYESVWVVVLPVQLAELLFPARRDEPWVGKTGLGLASLAFLLGSFVAWYSWTQVARIKVFHMPEYRPPLVAVVLAIAAIVILVAAAFSPWTASRPSRSETARSAPGPWLVGLKALLFGLPWSVLVLLGYGVLPSVPFEVPMIAGVGWVCVVLSLVARWTSSRDWDDRHRFALVFGGFVACMVGGFVIFAVGGALPIDWIGKAVLDVMAILGLARLGDMRATARSSGWGGPPACPAIPRR